MEMNVSTILKQLNAEYSEEKASEIIETLLYNPIDLTDEDHDTIDHLGDKFLRIAAQIFVEDLSYDFNTLVNYWEAFIGQLTEEQSQNLLNFALEQTDVDFVEDFIIGYRKFYSNPKESITFFNKLNEEEFYEIKFFKARCYEVLGEDEKAIESYNNYLNSDYFKLDENKEQAAVNEFYINHTIASLLVKLNKYDEANVVFQKVLGQINFEDYLENFDQTNNEEVKLFLADYVKTLEQIGEKVKANEVSEKIKTIFS
jgi:tetratricopeptide (TPR) repeat protein